MISPLTRRIECGRNVQEILIGRRGTFLQMQLDENEKRREREDRLRFVDREEQVRVEIVM